MIEWTDDSIYVEFLYKQNGDSWKGLPKFYHSGKPTVYTAKYTEEIRFRISIHRNTIDQNSWFLSCPENGFDTFKLKSENIEDAKKEIERMIFTKDI